MGGFFTKLIFEILYLKFLNNAKNATYMLLLLRLDGSSIFYNFHFRSLRQTLGRNIIMETK